jgi:type IV pilus assembly protein PilP
MRQAMLSVCSIFHAHNALCSVLKTGTFVFCLCSLCLLTRPRLAQSENSPDTIPDWINALEYTYSAKNRVDPFASFIFSEPKDKETDKQSKRTQTPLEQVEPSQLRLVGILDAGNERGDMALVELPNGKGYILRPGTKIGQNQGIVTVINNAQVTIKEKNMTPWGEEVLHSVVLELRQSSGEGDEG